MPGKRSRTQLEFDEFATKPHTYQKRIKLCDLCETMVNGSNDLKSLMTPQGYFHSSKVELFANARKGCPICFWIHNLLCVMWSCCHSGHVYFHALNSSRAASGRPSRPNRLVATIIDQASSEPIKFPKIYFSISGTWNFYVGQKKNANQVA